MSALGDWATLVTDDLGGYGMEIERRSPMSPVACRVWLPGVTEAVCAFRGARILGLRPFEPIKENPHTAADGGYQLVVHLTEAQVAEAWSQLARPGILESSPKELDSGPRGVLE